MYKVLIAICCGGEIYADTVTSLLGALETLRDKNVDYGLSIVSGGYKPLSCNKQVQTAKEQGCTHIMFIDADMIFPSSGIIRLIDHDKDIVGANYNVRGNPSRDPGREFTIKPTDPRKTPKHLKGQITTFEMPANLFKVWSLGLGFVLIKMSVFDKLDKPYFNDYESPEGEHHTEDVEFFTKCQDRGIDVWCSPTIRVGHIGSKTY